MFLNLNRRFCLPTLLHIDSSPRHDSTSSSLAAKFVENYKAKHTDTKVLHHNTTLETLPYVTEMMINGGFTPPDKRSPEMKEALAFSDKLTQEVLDADAIVFGIPMWNFSIPASLKAWVDLIVRNGLTFQYGPAGPVGLIPAGKKVYAFAARGGAYNKDSPAHAYDMQEPYLRGILGFLGLTDLSFIAANNQARGPEEAKAGLALAEAEMEKLLA